MPKGTITRLVDLSYDGNQLSMVIVLPDAAQFNAFESTLNSQKVNDIISSLKYQQVSLTMPKFKIESEFSLKKTLSAMEWPRPLAMPIFPAWTAAKTCKSPMCTIRLTSR